LCPRLTLRGLGAAKDSRAMPIDPRRRDDIVAAVAAHDSADPSAPLPRNTARLLAAMFASEDVCQRSLEDIAAEGFARNRLPTLLRRLVEAGLLSRERGSAREPNTYRLHLPPV
jgi:hypothetical protein